MDQRPEARPTSRSSGRSRRRLIKRFAVKLVRVPPAKEEEVIYIVLGAGPLSVFRDEDYERAMNMDNNPAPKKRR